MNLPDMTNLAEARLARPSQAYNEPPRSYAPGTPERAAIAAELQRMLKETAEMPLVIGGKPVRTGRLEDALVPHDHAHILGKAHLAGPAEIESAIQAAKDAAPDWSRRHWSERAAVFLKAADLVAGPWRDRLNAATMLGQSKTVHQAEADAATELVDFWRFNVDYMLRIYQEQPLSSPGVVNRVDYRPLEGFVFAVSPFNFTAIAGNLASAPALMGNTVVLKPASSAKLSAHYLLEILKEAGLPDGVINLVYGDARQIADIALSDPSLAGVHFTGSTTVFNGILKAVGAGIDHYRTYPRVVGETGGKNFILAHPSADVAALATAIIRGAFEYQGQKCSAASRIFVPQSLWRPLRDQLCDEIATIRMGDVGDFRNFMSAVIDEKAWTRHAKAIAEARAQGTDAILAGGEANKKKGFFISPTLIQTQDVRSRLLQEELFGPIATVFVYPDKDFAEMIQFIDRTSLYGLTGSIFATDPQAIAKAAVELRNATGNFYINDKPTGAVVGHQPFGGARASGTNDKAGSIWNLTRWVSPRAIKETLAPPIDYRYPFMESA